mmetsp:Transcript_156332/g.499279  ORF Transcript_156332/g.499279 Transcript_156332/m.499279 type:complete len:226 (+) Transcript_156332:683-1360(+)
MSTTIAMWARFRAHSIGGRRPHPAPARPRPRRIPAAAAATRERGARQCSGRSRSAMPMTGSQRIHSQMPRSPKPSRTAPTRASRCLFTISLGNRSSSGTSTVSRRLPSWSRRSIASRASRATCSSSPSMEPVWTGTSWYKTTSSCQIVLCGCQQGCVAECRPAEHNRAGEMRQEPVRQVRRHRWQAASPRCLRHSTFSSSKSRKPSRLSTRRAPARSIPKCSMPP